MNKKSLISIYENLAYTHKVHEYEAYLSKLVVTTIRILSILMLSTALALQYLDAKFQTRDYTSISISLTVISVLMQVFQLSFGFESKHDVHRSTAKSAVAIKNKMKIFIDEISLHTTDERDAIIEEINAVYETAPQTGMIAKLLADKAMKSDK